MLENSRIVFEQIIIMFLLMALGFFLFRRDVLDNYMTKKLSTLLTTFVGPCCIIEAFQREFEPVMAGRLGISFLTAVVVLVISMVIANLIYPKSQPDRRNCIVLTNNGFMAIPLMTAMFGPLGVFLGAGHIVATAIVQWTYAVGQLDANYRFTPKKVLTTPGVLASLLGLVLFVSPVKLPETVFSAVTLMADVNTPLAMLILGAYLAQIDWKEMFLDKAVWKTTLIRMLLIPAITVAVLLPIPLDAATKTVLMVAIAAPTGIVTAMFAQMYDTDYLFATRVVGLTTLLSLGLLPGWIAVLSAALRWIG